MKYSNSYILCSVLFVVLALNISACKKDGNPNKLPSVSPDDYAGLIEGYNSSDEIFPDKLAAYWSFDENKTEKLTGTAPTSTANDQVVEGGVRGKALSLNGGYLYYATQFSKFKTDSLKSFSISLWVKILNNGTKRTMLFQLARPGIFNGNINFILNTNAFPASNTDILRIQPVFTTVGGGTQDNLNNSSSPKIGADKWTHIAVTYDGSTGVFNIWADGKKVGDYSNRGTGNNLFKSYEPSEVIIGSNYNGIPGKEVNTDANFAPMTGQLDEIRIYNITLPDAHINALYKLGLANK